MTLFLKPLTPWLWPGLLCTLVGCGTPGIDVPSQQTTRAQDLRLSEAPSLALPAQWWQSLGDPALDALVTTALQGSPSMATAQLRWQRMQALSGVARAASSVQTSAGADLTRQRFSANGLYPRPIAGNIWDNDTVQANLSWSPDFWGQHAAEFAAAWGQTRAAQADAAAARTLLASQVCKTYITLARLWAQRDLAQRSLTQKQTIHTLITARQSAGLDTSWERNPAEINIAEAQAQWEALQEQIMLVRHQLAALTGQAPQALDALQPKLTSLRLQALPAQLSADLLGRRPEVVASRWRVEAASQDVAVARTQFYPNLNLSAFVGFNALGLSHLLDAGSQQVGITPALRLPLFDGGRLQSQYATRQSERDLAVAQYNQTVLDAVRETADAIGTTQSLHKQMQTQASALHTAEHQYALVQQRFDAGLVNALTVLATQNAVLAQERLYIDLQARQLDNQVQLMKALGGGWQDATATTDQ